MAKVTVTTTPPVKPVKTYTLELSQPEANALVEVLARVGGARYTTARGYAQDIADELYDAGVVRDHTAVIVDPKYGNGIYFTAASRAIVEREG